MPIRLDSADADFEHQFLALLGGKRESSQDVSDTVTAIIADVRARGDAAVVDYTNRFDRTHFATSDLKISAEDIAAAVAFLAAPEARFVTGTALAVDGGRLARL